MKRLIIDYNCLTLEVVNMLDNMTFGVSWLWRWTCPKPLTPFIGDFCWKFSKHLDLQSFVTI